MATTREAAPSVRLNSDWQAKYRRRVQQLLAPSDPQSVDFTSSSTYFSVCLVGRSGVGKGSLINHLLRRRASRVSEGYHDVEEHVYDFRGLFSLREIPGYDGWHSDQDQKSPPRRHRFHFSLHGSSHIVHKKHYHHNYQSSHSSDDSDSNHSSDTCYSKHSSDTSYSSHSSDISYSSHSSSNNNQDGITRKLDLDEFAQKYGLFKEETKAIIFVVKDSITEEEQKLMQLAVDNRKFFCIVRTHADTLTQITDISMLENQLEHIEEQLRKDLSLAFNLNVRVFILSIPFPEVQETSEELTSSELEDVMRNTQALQFSLLQAYLTEPKGLYDELQIHSFVKEEVWKALEPFWNVKKRHQALDFTQHLVAGTLIPIAGPVMVSFIKSLRYTLKACSDVGLIEDSDDAMEKITAEVNKHSLSAQIASKEGLLTAVHDTLVHIFGKVVFEIAIAEVVSTAAETALSGTLPLVGPVISAAHLPIRFKKIAERLAVKACMLHELWIMQNITGLLSEF